jgi:hypothetical protein
MRRARFTALAVIVAVAGITMSTAQGAAKPPFQTNVQAGSNPDADNWRGGEPEIAVNPRDPQNMVMVWAAMKQLTDPKTGVTYPGALAQFASPATGMQTIQCQMAYTFDGGETWTGAIWPLREKPSCGDPMVVADSTGAFEITFDLMGSVYTPSTEGTQPTDQVAASRSTDGGRHWSKPVDVGTIVDRPFFRIDPSTDWLYEVSGGAITLSTPRQLVISRDHGKTWTPKQSFPSDHLAVNHGVIATTLQAGNPAAFTFAVSHDNGATYEQSAIPGASSGGSGDWVSADPTQPGRFAAMQQVGDTLEILTTNDNGKTWSSPLHVGNAGRTVGLPWFDFGPRGDLGVMWKSTDPATSQFLVYAALLKAGSTRFSHPLVVSSTPSAGADFVNEGAGDDLSWITVDRNNAYIGWGDRRTGMLQAWFARVRLDDF